MVRDLVHENNEDEVIEVLIRNPDAKVGVWIPIITMNLYSVGNDGELYKVEEVRVRNFKKEEEEDQRVTLFK